MQPEIRPALTHLPLYLHPGRLRSLELGQSWCNPTARGLQGAEKRVKFFSTLGLRGRNLMSIKIVRCILWGHAGSLVCRFLCPVLSSPCNCCRLIIPQFRVLTAQPLARAQSQTTREPLVEQIAENPEAKAEEIEVKNETANGLVVVGVEQEASKEQQVMDKQEETNSAQNAAATMTSSADEEPIDIDLNDPDVQAAAAKIQKGWGNRRAAAAVATESQQKQQEQPKPQVEAKVAEQEEVVDIDLNDPEVQAAAAKIQKGWGTRKLAAKQQTPQ